jgi:hypothetical protein
MSGSGSPRNPRMDSNRRPSWIARLEPQPGRLRQAKTGLTLVLSVVIGALVSLVVVAFILLTGRLAARMYPAGGSGWRRILVPTLGSLSTGYLTVALFPVCARQRNPANEVRALHQRRANPFPNRVWKVLLLLGLACQRNRARPRRAVRAGGRGTRLGGRAEPGTRSETA